MCPTLLQGILTWKDPLGDLGAPAPAKSPEEEGLKSTAIELAEKGGEEGL